MALNRSILSLESLDDRIVLDASPALPPVPEPPAAGTPVSIPANPAPLPIPPAPPAEGMTLQQVEELLRRMQVELLRLEALYREAQRAMLNAASNQNDAMLAYWASVTVEYFRTAEQYVKAYKAIHDAYDAAALRGGRQIPDDIDDFDPDQIEWVPALPPPQGGPYT